MNEFQKHNVVENKSSPQKHTDSDPMHTKFKTAYHIGGGDGSWPHKRTCRQYNISWIKVLDECTCSVCRNHCLHLQLDICSCMLYLNKELKVKELRGSS